MIRVQNEHEKKTTENSILGIHCLRYMKNCHTEEVQMRAYIYSWTFSVDHERKWDQQRPCFFP